MRIKRPSGTLTRARELRRDATDAEKALWRGLREALPHAKFRRQVPYGPYFADFLSFSVRLVVEVDGGQHAERIEQDDARTRFLEAQGFRVLRVWNNDVLENIDGVLRHIAVNLNHPHPPKAGALGPSLSQSGRGKVLE
jgi:very-short-patch-repair endonuclease